MSILLFVIYIVFISLGLPDSLFGVTWPVVHVEFGISESFASVYSIITGLCTGGVSFMAGKLIRRFGTGKVTLVSILLTAIGMLGISLSPNIIVMMICSIVLGYGAGAIDTGLNNYVSLHYEARHMNWLHCFWGVGVTMSPMIMAQFLGGTIGSWRNGYQVVVLIQLAIAALVLATLQKWDKSSDEDVVEEVAEASEKTAKEIFRIKGVGASILTMGFYCGAEFLLGVWGASFAINVFGVAPDVAARWVALYYGGIMLGRMISGFASMRMSDNALIRAGIIASAVGVLTLWLPIGSYALAGFFLIGLGFGPIFPSVIHSVPERFGKAYSADITGYHMGGAYAVGFFVQLTFGYVAAATTFEIAQYVLLALCAGMFVANQRAIKAVKKEESLSS